MSDPIPFSNGTEERAWMAKWCDYCTHDHEMHTDEGSGCTLLTHYMVTVGTEDYRTPEPWLPEPDDGQFALPSRMCCLKFSPCESCGGDPGASDRAVRITEVTDYWRTHRRQSA